MTKGFGAIANLEWLRLSSNPLLDIDRIPFEYFWKLRRLDLFKNSGMSGSTIKKLPNTLVQLAVDLNGNGNPSAADFQHLTKLRELTIYTNKCDCGLYKQLSSIGVREYRNSLIFDFSQQNIYLLKILLKKNLTQEKSHIFTVKVVAFRPCPSFANA